MAAATRWLRSSPSEVQFPPSVLREYALLADGERGALVGPRGEVAWTCAPSWDSAAVFSGLLGGNGTYAVTPTELRAVWGGYYEPGSLIWVERWITTHAIIECREALALPSDPHTAVVLRRLRAIQGDAVLMADLWPRADFGRHPMRDLRRRGGRWSARSGSLWLRWSGASRALRSEDGLRAAFRLAPGQHHDLVLEISDRAFKDGPPDADRTWQQTEAAWSEAVPRLDACLNSRQAGHAYAVLHGLTTRAGGTVGAATTSLPERAESGRDYDYRYAWIRDQCYVGQALAGCGPPAQGLGPLPADLRRRPEANCPAGLGGPGGQMERAGRPASELGRLGLPAS
ncbi:MAG: trehalase-like domain-containing protein [Candidatus Dormibacteria bacterium]